MRFVHSAVLDKVEVFGESLIIDGKVKLCVIGDAGPVICQRHDPRGGWVDVMTVESLDQALAWASLQLGSWQTNLTDAMLKVVFAALKARDEA